jgi:gas vesicle protein
MIGYMQGVRDTLSRRGLVRRSRPGFLTAFALGAGIGLIAGAAVAMLLTPSSGRDMRRELGYKAKKLAERTQTAVTNVKGKLAGAKEDAKARLEERHTRNESPIG